MKYCIEYGGTFITHYIDNRNNFRLCTDYAQNTLFVSLKAARYLIFTHNQKYHILDKSLFKIIKYNE